MPTAHRDGVALYYETAGTGPTVAFVGDAGYGAWQWSWQHAALAGRYETLVYDHRGTGRSDAPLGPYAVETLVDDLEAVLAAAGTRAAHLVGAGLGGMVALAYARRHGRARSLSLFGTAAYGEGIDAAACRALDRATSRSFRAAQPEVVEGIREWRRAEDADDAGWRAHVGTVESFDARDWLHEVIEPAMVAHGTADAVWPLERGEALADALPRSEFRALDGAGHLAWIEHSRVVNDRLVGFLDRHVD